MRSVTSNQAKAKTPAGVHAMPLCLQRCETAQSLSFSTRLLAIYNPAD